MSCEKNKIRKKQNVLFGCSRKIGVVGATNV
jgi:hypothetical protein